MLWYFPPYLDLDRCLLLGDLAWHHIGRQIDSTMWYPAYSPTWKLIDHKWPEFGCEPRNLCLALSVDRAKGVCDSAVF